jgi:hypothetical protein
MFYMEKHPIILRLGWVPEFANHQKSQVCVEVRLGITWGYFDNPFK